MSSKGKGRRHRSWNSTQRSSASRQSRHRGRRGSTYAIARKIIATIAPRARKLIPSSQRTTDRRSIAPTRFKDESSALKAPVLKAAAKKETKPPKPSVAAVSPAPKPAVLGERKRVPGH